MNMYFCNYIYTDLNTKNVYKYRLIFDVIIYIIIE